MTPLGGMVLIPRGCESPYRAWIAKELVYLRLKNQPCPLSTGRMTGVYKKGGVLREVFFRLCVIQHFLRNCHTENVVLTHSIFGKCLCGKTIFLCVKTCVKTLAPRTRPIVCKNVRALAFNQREYEIFIELIRHS